MYKQILLVKQAEALLQGFTEPVARLIEPGHVKRAQADSDTPMQEELREYIRTLKPQKDSTYVLVNAMGDGEHYGDNINGDFFPYEELVHTDEEFRKLAVHDWTGRRDKAAKLGWGFTTFYHAHVYQHHINKDPAKAFGTIDWAGWNTKMRRVELVTRLDHAWCKERGGMSILEKAHRNDFQDVSMGCVFDPHACVTMANGTQKPICEIKEGDEVLTHLGRSGRVSAVFTQRHRGNVHRIHLLFQKEALPLTPEHPVLVLTNTGEDGGVEAAVWRRVDELRAWRDVLLSPLPPTPGSLVLGIGPTLLDGVEYTPYLVEGITTEEFDGIVYNFSVEGDESYLVEKVATHNCKVPYDVCFPKGTEILSASGLQNIENLSVGEEVFTHKGRVRRVQHTFVTQYDGPMVHLRVFGLHKEISATSKHPFYVLKDKGTKAPNKRRYRPEQIKTKAVWEEAQNLSEGDYLLMPTHYFNENGGEAHNKSVEYARLCGLFCGDGFRVTQKTGKKKNGPKRLMGIGFSANEKEEGIQKEIESMLDACSPEKKYKKYAVSQKSEVSYRLYNQELANEVVSDCGQTCHEKRVPAFLWCSSIEHRLAFLGGLLDTDGSIDGQGKARVCLVNERLSLEAKTLAVSVGICASISAYASSSSETTYTTGATQVYQTYLPAADVHLLAPYSYKAREKGKTAKWAASKSFYWHDQEGVRYLACPVSSVQSSHFQGEVYNLSVEGDESYLVGGYAVHNCSICGHKAKTPLEYCEHIRERRTNRDPRGDGTRPYMINIRPRFFDLSYVFIGADKTARSLMKIAMAGLEAETQIYDYIYDDVRRQHPKMQQQEAHKLAHALYEAGYSPYAYAPFPTYEANDAGLYLQSHRHDTSPHTPPHQKTASSAASHFLGHGLHMAHHHHLDDKLKQRLGELKQRLHRHQEGAGDAIREKASALKLSDLIKYRVPHPNAEEVSRLEKGQRMLPGRVIDQSIKERGLEGTLHDSAREGIVLRKPEFARAVLRSTGLGRLMPTICSRPLPRSDDFSLPIGLLGGSDIGNVLRRGTSIFSPFARVRSVKPDCVMLRITIIQPMNGHHHHHDDFDDDDCYGEEFGKYASVRDPSSEKVAEMISAAYNGYRAWLLAHAEDFGLLDVGVEKGASSEYGRYRSRGGSYGGLSAEEKGRLAFTDLALSWSHWR